jgi:ABC-type nitrate/sulfonate/bicarbonate transport system substrate-binding protein
MRTPIAARTCAVIVFMTLLMFAGPSLAQKLTVGWSAVSALNAPFWVMKDAGFLQEEGLDGNLVYIPSSSTSLKLRSRAM